MSFETTFTFNILKYFRKQVIEKSKVFDSLSPWAKYLRKLWCPSSDAAFKKAASKLGLHYFLCRINATPAVKGLRIKLCKLILIETQILEQMWRCLVQTSFPFFFILRNLVFFATPFPWQLDKSSIIVETTRCFRRLTVL